MTAPTNALRWAVLALAAALLLAAAGQWLSGDRSLRRLQQLGVIRIGYAVEAPYAWVTARGQVTGESPETARRITARIGVPQVEWIQSPFGRLIPGLLEKRFDVIAAGLFITAERARQVRFSAPTVRVMAGLLVRRGNPKGIVAGMDGLRRADVGVAVLEGAVEQARLRAAGVAAERLLAVPDVQAGRSAVASGAADALVLSLPTLRWIAASESAQFDVLPDAGAQGAPADLVGFAFRPEDVELLRAWNAAQAELVMTAEYERLVQAFGFAPEDIVARSAAGVAAR